MDLRGPQSHRWGGVPMFKWVRVDVSTHRSSFPVQNLDDRTLKKSECSIDPQPTNSSSPKVFPSTTPPPRPPPCELSEVLASFFTAARLGHHQRDERRDGLTERGDAARPLESQHCDRFRRMTSLLTLTQTQLCGHRSGICCSRRLARAQKGFAAFCCCAIV